jgi:hypothetical protein
MHHADDPTPPRTAEQAMYREDGELPDALIDKSGPK